MLPCFCFQHIYKIRLRAFISSILYRSIRKVHYLQHSINYLTRCSTTGKPRTECHKHKPRPRGDWKSWSTHRPHLLPRHTSYPLPRASNHRPAHLEATPDSTSPTTPATATASSTPNPRPSPSGLSLNNGKTTLSPLDSTLKVCHRGFRIRMPGAFGALSASMWGGCNGLLRRWWRGQGGMGGWGIQLDGEEEGLVLGFKGRCELLAS